MRDYKVGDTIAVKAKVIRATNGSEMPYQVSYITGYDNDGLRSGNSFWVTDSEIVEPVKPVLPKDVAKELEITKKLNVTFDGYIMRVIDDQSHYTNSHTFWMNSDDGVIKILMDAWYNGYTIEQVPRYMVYVPGTNKHYLYVKRGSWAKASNKKTTPITPQFINNYLATSSNHRDLYWFTYEEITKFDLQDCEKELVADD